MEIFSYMEAVCETNTLEWEKKSGITFNPCKFKGTDQEWKTWHGHAIEELTGHLNGACNNL